MDEPDTLVAGIVRGSDCANSIAKAWEQVDRVAAQAWRPLYSVLVTLLDRATDGPEPVPAELVLKHDVVLGSVSANRRHVGSAAGALAPADRRWLEGLITRRVPLARWTGPLGRRPSDVKTVIEFGTAV